MNREHIRNDTESKGVSARGGGNAAAVPTLEAAVEASIRVEKPPAGYTEEQRARDYDIQRRWGRGPVPSLETGRAACGLRRAVRGAISLRDRVRPQ